MQLAYPIVHILFYIAMLFAPQDADRVSITGPDHLFELTRTDGTWKFTGKDATGTASVRDRKVELIGNGKTDTLSVVEYVAAAIGHDWVKQPKITLQDQNTLEKTAEGFVLRTDDGKPGMKEYRIKFHQSAEKTAGVSSINVLGAVKQPGIYKVVPGSGVPDAVTAAGGLTEKVDRVECRILRGEGGAFPKVIQVPWEAILNIIESGPKLELQDHDTLYISAQKTGQTVREAAKTLQFRWVAAEGDAESPADVFPDPNDPSGRQTLRVLRDVVLDHTDIEHAEVTKPDGDREIRVSFSEAGAKKIAAATKTMTGRQLAIVWIGRVISAPRIMTPITGGFSVITGRFTAAELDELIAALNAIHIDIAADGALTLANQPCPLDQLTDKLRKLAEKNAVSVVVYADEKVPFQQVQTILDSCKAAGIKESALRLTTP